MKIRFSFIIGLIILVVFGLSRITINFWAPLIVRFLIVNDALKKSDIIIILSGGINGDRIRYGANLYKNGYASKLLLSGSFYLWEETKIDLMKIYLMQLGVPEKAIMVDHNSDSTVENAISATEIVLKNGFRSILIVTSPPHSRRTKIVFKKIFPNEIGVRVSCDLSNFNYKNWWKNTNLTREIIHEYFVFLWYVIFGFK